MPAAAPELQTLAQDSPLVEALRAGDERAFLGLVGSLHPAMMRFARGFVRSEASAEDVVQDTWAVVLEDIDRFEGRSTLRSWIFGILGNGSHPRHAGRPRHPAVGARAHRRRARRRSGGVLVPFAPALGRALGEMARTLARRAAPHAGDAGARRRRDRSAAGGAARRDPAARRRRLELGGGLRGPRAQRRQRARPAASGAFPRAARDRPARRTETPMSRALSPDLDCIVAVEQVTDYLEGALPLEARTEFEQHLVSCPGCVIYLRQVRAQVAASGKLAEPRPVAEEVTRKLLEMFHASRGG